MKTTSTPPPWHRPASGDAPPLSVNAVLAFVLAVGGWIMFAMAQLWTFAALEAVAFAIGFFARRDIDSGRLSGRIFASLALGLPTLAAAMFATSRIESDVIPIVERLRETLAF